MSEPTRRQKIKARQDRIRAWMLGDRLHNPLFEPVLSINTVGRYMERRWYSFGQLALHSMGDLLGTDGQWAEIEREMRDWPSLLWVSTLTRAATMSQAKKVYGASGKFGITTAVDPVRIVAATWAPATIKKQSALKVWGWLGPVGGVMPAAPPADDE